MVLEPYGRGYFLTAFLALVLYCFAASAFSRKQ